VEELKALFEELERIYRTMVFVGAWSDCVSQRYYVRRSWWVSNWGNSFRLCLCVNLSAEGMA
jgi:hypothetical protein